MYSIIELSELFTHLGVLPRPNGVHLTRLKNKGNLGFSALTPKEVKRRRGRGRLGDGEGGDVDEGREGLGTGREEVWMGDGEGRGSLH